MKNNIIVLIVSFIMSSIAFSAPVATKAPSKSIFFDDTTPFDLTILTDWRKVYSGKKTVDPYHRPYTKASFVHKNVKGKTKNLLVNLRVRGWSRLAECKFPPLKVKRIDSKTATPELLPYVKSKKTLFKKTKSMKIVTRCNSSERSRWARMEHVIYKMYESMTPLSFKTRGANITYLDRPERNYDQLTGKQINKHYGFFIESEKDFAKRKNYRPLIKRKFPIRSVSVIPLNFMYMFGIMIGNHDLEISRSELRNVKIFLTSKGNYVPVPYDFDWAQVIREGTVSYDRLPMNELCGLKPRFYENMKNRFLNRKGTLLNVISNSKIINSSEKTILKNAVNRFMNKLQDRRFNKQMLRTARRRCR